MVNESIAHITCGCGAQVQVLNEDGTDWDAVASDLAYQEHLTQDCPNVEREEVVVEEEEIVNE